MIKRWSAYPFNPVLNIDPMNFKNIQAYQSLAITGTGTSGTNTITASATATLLMFIGQKFRIGGTDEYIVSNLSGSTITTTTNLTSSYSSSTIETLKISQIYDLSGNTPNITQATADTQPTYVQSGINSKPTLGYDGTNDLLVLTATAATNNVFSNGGTCAFIFNARSSGGGTAGRVWQGAEHIMVAHICQFSQVTTGTTWVWKPTSAPSLNTNYVVLMTYNAATISTAPVFYVNSTSSSAVTTVVTGSGTATTSTGDWNLWDAAGGIRCFDGFAGPLLLWKRILTTAEIKYVMKYLGNQYGIAIS